MSDLPTPEEMVRAVRLGAAIKQTRDPETGHVIDLKIVWPGWPGGKLPVHDSAPEAPDAP
jgi:hypothetical protein